MVLVAIVIDRKPDERRIRAAWQKTFQFELSIGLILDAPECDVHDMDVSLTFFTQRSDRKISCHIQIDTPEVSVDCPLSHASRTIEWFHASLTFEIFDLLSQNMQSFSRSNH